MSRTLAALLAVIVSCAAMSQELDPIDKDKVIDDQAVTGAYAEMRGLDTIKAAASDFSIRVGDSARFGRLTVEVSDCRYFADNSSINSFAYVKVTDAAENLPFFSAWMIAGSPALSAIDHPRYDIWLIRCSAEIESESNG